MNGKHYVGRKARSTTIGAKQPPISKVILTADDDLVFEAGDDTGKTLEAYIPSATQRMANDILAKVKGFEYQGYSSENAFIPPTVELGDGVNIGGIYGVLANRDYSFTPKITETISAPYDDEEDHEYGYLGNYKHDINQRVKLGYLYYGTRISRKNGLEIVKTDGEKDYTRVILNSDRLVFYDAEGREAFYYDQNEGKFMINNRVNIEGALGSSEKYLTLVVDTEKLRVDVNDAQGNISNLQLTAKDLQLQIKNEIDNRNTAINIKAGELTAAFQAADQGLQNQITVNYEGLSAKISDANGNINSLKVTASELSTQISNTDGRVTSLKTTVDGLSSQVSDKSIQTKIEQTVSRIELSVLGSDYNKEGKIGTTLELTLDGAGITAADIEFTGVVTFNSVKEGGTTIIDGSRIQTGSIDAEMLNLSGLFSVTDGPDGDVGGFIGYGRGKTNLNATEGITMIDYTGNYRFIATNEGARMSYKRINEIYVNDDGCWADPMVAEKSDRCAKNSISYDLDNYKKLLKILRPANFKLNNDPYNLTHTGYIAQDLEEAIKSIGMNIEEFGVLAYTYRDKKKEYFIRYSEFIPILAALCDDYEQRIQRLEARL